MKKTLKFVILTLSLLLLPGCSDEKRASGNISETEYNTALETASVESSVTEMTVLETNSTEKASETEETVTSFPAEEKSEEQQRLEQIISEAAKKENPALK
ncbi:MAG: hypothetical protein ACI4RG_01375, partial [Huintestinicola sp.]